VTNHLGQSVLGIGRSYFNRTTYAQSTAVKLPFVDICCDFKYSCMFILLQHIT